MDADPPAQGVKIARRNTAVKNQTIREKDVNLRGRAMPQARFRARHGDLAPALGHADRVMGFVDCRVGLL